MRFPTIVPSAFQRAVGTVFAVSLALAACRSPSGPTASKPVPTPGPEGIAARIVTDWNGRPSRLELNRQPLDSKGQGFYYLFSLLENGKVTSPAIHIQPGRGFGVETPAIEIGGPEPIRLDARKAPSVSAAYVANEPLEALLNTSQFADGLESGLTFNLTRSDHQTVTFHVPSRAFQRLYDESVRFCYPPGAAELTGTDYSEPLHLGMTSAEVQAAWGKPVRIDRTLTQGGNTETWTYPATALLRLNAGVLTRIHRPTRSAVDGMSARLEESAEDQLDPQGPDHARRARYLSNHPDLAPEVREAVREGFLQLGLSSEQVHAAWGAAMRIDKPQAGTEVWHYAVQDLTIQSDRLVAIHEVTTPTQP